MKKKALLVAVGSSYEGHAKVLKAPEYELTQWRQLLSVEPYQFEVTPLLDPPLDLVVHHLRILLTEPAEDDELLFVAMCHGKTLRTQSPGHMEEALIMNPAGVGIDAAALRESTLRNLFEELRPPNRTRVDFFIDACYSGGYGSPLPQNVLATGRLASAIPLGLPADIPSGVSVARFGDFARATVHAHDYAKPVLMAAAEKDKFAWELDFGGRRRLLYTKRLLESLRRRYDTFRNTHRAIQPLDEGVDQVPVLAGNASRHDEKFPYPLNAEGLESVGATNVTNDTHVSLRVMGIACFINARDMIGANKARIVLPYDDRPHADPKEKHIAVMEIATEDILAILVNSYPGEPPYLRAGEEWTRWMLNGHTVEVEGAVFGQPFVRKGFDVHVPKLIDIAQELAPFPPHWTCFEEAPLMPRFAGFVNLLCGEAELGSIRTIPVHYERKNSPEPPSRDYYTPRSVRVKIPINGDDATIVLRSRLNPSQTRLEVKVRSGAEILIANAREIDITGNGAGNVPEEQFLLYYKVAEDVPEPPPLPKSPSIPSDDCTVTDYP